MTNAEMQTSINAGIPVLYKGKVLRTLAELPSDGQILLDFPEYAYNRIEGNAKGILGYQIVGTPADTQTLIFNGTDKKWEFGAGGGGSTSPGGSNKQIQFNNNGSFGGATELVYENNRLGVGNGSPNWVGGFTTNGQTSLEIYKEFTGAWTDNAGGALTVNLSLNPSSVTAGLPQASAVYADVVTLAGDSTNWSTLKQLDGLVDHNGTGTVGYALGYRGQIYNEGTGNITNARGLSSFIANYGAGVITNSIGVLVENGGGNFTNAYGMYVGDHSSAGTTTSLNIYSAGTNSNNKFDGTIVVKNLTSTTAASGSVGSVTLPFKYNFIAGDSATPGTNNFKITGTATAARTITLPDASGTLLYSGGPLGTPSGGTLTNATGLPPTTGIVGWPANSAGVLTNNGSGVLSWGSAGASPSGSGTEIQARGGASSFGAVTGSSTTNGDITLVGQAVSGGDVLLDMTPGASTAIAAEVPTFVMRTATLTTNATIADYRFNKFLRPTLASNSSRTTTNAATLYIDNAPAAGTNMTITNPYSLWVDDGNTRLDGFLGVGTTAPAATQFYVQAQSSGNITAQFDSSSGANVDIMLVRRGTTNIFQLTSGGKAIFTSPNSGSAMPYFRIDSSADTVLGGSEIHGIKLGGDSSGNTVTRQFSSTFTTQREYVFTHPTYSMVAASQTITNAATVAIKGAPIASTNLTITNPYALWVQSGATKHSADGIGTTNTTGIELSNETAASAGAQQISPDLIFTAQGWKTTATAASQTVNFRQYVLPVQGTTAPTALWTMQSQINGGGYSTIFSVGNTGILRGAGGVLTVADQVYSNTGLKTDGYVVVGNSTTTSPIYFGSGTDTTVFRASAAGTWQWGGGTGDAASPQAVTFKAQSVVAGTTDTAGANWTFAGSRSTGTGAGGSIIFQVAPPNATGTTQNSLATAFTLASTSTTLTVPTPVQLTTGAVAGYPVAITASNATASSSTAGAAAGGSVTITAGDAARLTSGNANGGDIALIPGAGIGTGIYGSVWIRKANDSSVGTVAPLKMRAPFNTTGSRFISFYSLNETSEQGYISSDSGHNGLTISLSKMILGDIGSGVTSGQAQINYTTTGGIYIQSGALNLGSATVLGWTSAEPYQTKDLTIRRSSAANLAFGAADAASPVAQTLSVQGVSSGTSNTAGAIWTLKGSASTGNVNGGAIDLQVTPAGTSGTSVNSHISAFKINGDTSIQVPSTVTTGGTTGNQTINKASGTVNVAASGTSVTVTNSLVTANSLIMTNIRTNDATAVIKNVVASAGSFVINMATAPTGEVSIGFFVINQ